MIHSVREACGSGGLRLEKVVDSDETYIGGKRWTMSNSEREELAGTVSGPVWEIPVVWVRERGGRVKAVAFTADTRMD